MNRPRGISNEQAFANYRSLVGRDITRPTLVGAVPGPDWAQRTLVTSHWMSRYSRRRDAIEGISGYGSPLLDQKAKELLVARHLARDAAYPEIPNWDPQVLSMIAMSLRNMRPTNRLDVGSLEEPCAYGPSLRQLWAQAKQRGATDSDAWDSITAWGFAAPPAWARDEARKKRRQPAIERAVSDGMARPVSWRRTGDLDRPWMATVDGRLWEVRLNDFPDEWMYTLIVDGSALGDFQDWPAAWNRTVTDAIEPLAEVAKPERPKVVAAGRFLERYLAGEHEAVWAELVSLGPDVREARYLAEARAVARETMRRVRHNVELLIQRLDSVGYQFWDHDHQTLPAARRSHGPVRDHLKDPNVFLPPGRGEGKALDALERDGLVLPLSLRAWMEEVGCVDLCGSHPTLCFFDGIPGADFPGIYADPLMVAPNADLVQELLGLNGEENDLLISFDAPGKAGLAANWQVDGQYSMEVPNPAADGLLKDEPHELYFVDYLRLSFRWGGFPGWAAHEPRPDRDLAALTTDLLPF